MKSKQLRIPLLIFVFASTFLVLGRVVLDPKVSKSKPTPIVFPQTVPLAGWKLEASEPFLSKTDESNQTIGKPLAKGKLYRYSQNNLLLDIEMVYELKKQQRLPAVFIKIQSDKAGS